MGFHELNNCTGEYIDYEIYPHAYFYRRCDKCGNFEGGTSQKEHVKRLLATKIVPRVRRLHGSTQG